MILLRSRLLRFFHFVKPTLSTIASRADLEAILQKRLLREVADINQQTLQHASFLDQARTLLKMSSNAAKDLEHRTIPLTIIHPASRQQQVLQARVSEKLQHLQVEGADLGLVGSNQALHHFSEDRGAPNFEELQEYPEDECTLLIFNLPDNINAQDIQATLRASDAKITFKYCILGLPAYATATFATPKELQTCLQKLPSRRIDFGERTAVVRGPEEVAKLKLGWRRMVVQVQEGSEMCQLAVELSRYGRVLHLDWPLEASINPSLAEVKDFYRDSTELVRINQIHRDGTLHSEFYPPLDVWQEGQDQRDEGNIVDRAQRLKQAYDHRARFARNVNVYLGKEHELSLNNRGYCVVTYSTPEECQSLYFRHGADTKMQLVEERLDFEWDPLFKKELLRQIDNEYLTGKKAALQRKQQQEKEFIDPIKEGLQGLEYQPKQQTKWHQRVMEPDDSFNLFDKIFNKICFQELTEMKNPTSYYLGKYRGQDNLFSKWDDHLKKYKDLKQKVDRKTFDELAELELYGRVLPKDQNIERIIVEDAKLRRNKDSQLIQENHLLTNFRFIMAKNKFYRRHQERKNRLANLEAGIGMEEAPEEEPIEEVLAEEADPNDGDNIGKAAFSTGRPPILYRKRTPEEEAVFQHRYQQFVRSTIYEYMGVFHDKEIEEASNLKQSVLNPRSLKWRDGSAFLEENDITLALQFRRDLPAAQQEYEDYVYGNEYLRSSSLTAVQINANRSTYTASALQTLTDVGLVESVRRVSGDDLQRKAEVLNAQAAQFGEEWRIEQREGENLLVKVRKLENLLPLHRVAHLERFISEHAEPPTPEQAALFEKHYQTMRRGDPIPDEVSNAFGVPRGLRFNDLLGEVGANFKIYRKDLEMAERARTYSLDQLKEDINVQMKMQRRRRHQRKIDGLSFAKDPSEIYVKDREGYYKVSRYRQI